MSNVSSQKREVDKTLSWIIAAFGLNVRIEVKLISQQASLQKRGFGR